VVEQEIDKALLARRLQIAQQAVYFAKRQKAKEDLYWLCTEILFKDDCIDYKTQTGMELYDEKYHRAMCARVQDPARKKLHLYARNTFKSYVVTVGDTIRKLLINPNERIVLGNVKLDNARKLVGHIKHLFANCERLKAIFPEYVPKDPKDFGTQDQFTVPCRTKFYREPSIMAVSTGSRLAGPHFSGAKIDDPIDQENCTTEEQIAGTKEWWERFQYLLDPGSWVDVVGTIYHYQDLYADPIISRGDYQVNRVPIAFKDDKGVWQSRFETRWPWKRLKSMMSSDDPVEQWNFWHQMMLEPKNIGDVKFDPAWLKTIDPNKVPPNLGRIITIDSAWKGEETRGHGDYTAIQVFGYDNLGHIYRQDCVYSNTLDILDGVGRICDLMAKWRISTVVIERVGQDTFGRIFTEECRRRGLGLRLVQPKRDLKQSKKDRIMALQPYFKLGQLMLVEGCAYNKEFTTQYTCFPNVIHDDLLDGTADVLLDEVKVMPQAHYRDDAWQSPVKPTGAEGENRVAAYAMSQGDPTARIRPNWGKVIEPDTRWDTPIPGAKHQ
jgi:predicted phage terminase large subunit-like protein